MAISEWELQCAENAQNTVNRDTICAMTREIRQLRAENERLIRERELVLGNCLEIHRPEGAVAATAALRSHYECAIANWKIAVRERKKAQ